MQTFSFVVLYYHEEYKSGHRTVYDNVFVLEVPAATEDDAFKLARDYAHRELLGDWLAFWAVFPLSVRKFESEAL